MLHYGYVYCEQKVFLGMLFIQFYDWWCIFLSPNLSMLDSNLRKHTDIKNKMIIYHLTLRREYRQTMSKFCLFILCFERQFNEQSKFFKEIFFDSPLCKYLFSSELQKYCILNRLFRRLRHLCKFNFAKICIRCTQIKKTFWK